MKLSPTITNKKSIKYFQTLEDRFNTVHNNKYDYSQSVFTRVKDKITIICPIHGKFEQIPDTHLRGNGCNKCGVEVTKSKVADTTDTFIKKAKNIYGNRFSYANTIYVNNHTKVTITCKQHGDFLTTPSTFLTGHACPKCSVIRSNRIKRQKIKSKIEQSLLTNTSPSIFDLTQFTSTNKVKATCKLCGTVFTQSAKTIYDNSQHSCPKCGPLRRVNSIRNTTESFIRKAQAIHTNKYEYSNVKYTTDKGEVEIICPYHGSFNQIASNHLQGNGCPQCGRENAGTPRKYFIGKPTILYFLMLPTTPTLYKLGITSKSVTERYKRESIDYTILNEIVYDNGVDAYDEEARLKEVHKEYLWRGGSPFKHIGTTEVFTHNIFDKPEPTKPERWTI